jgi:hypothetical protein
MTLTDTITAAGLTYNELDELWKALYRAQRKVAAQQHYVSQISVKLAGVTTRDRIAVDDVLDSIWDELDAYWGELLDLMDEVNNADPETVLRKYSRKLVGR